MRLLTRLLAVAVVVLILGGGLLLATWDVAPPTRVIEQVLPDDRFPR